MLKPAGFPCASPLLLYRRIKPRLIDGHALFATGLGHEIHRKPVGVIEFEDIPTSQNRLPCGLRFLDHLIQDRQPLVQRRNKPLFLPAGGFGNRVGRTGNLRIGTAHLAHHRRSQLMEKRFHDPEQSAMPGRTSQDSA